jgi:hypothetical protein
MMYLCVKNIKSTRLFKKLNYKYYDFYEIEKLINEQAYKLILFKNMRKIHNVFHVFLLESYKENLENAKSSFFIIIEDEDQWKVQDNLNTKKFHDKMQYYVRWLNYDDTHNQWISTQDMNASELIAKYFKKYSKHADDDRASKRRRRD